MAARLQGRTTAKRCPMFAVVNDGGFRNSGFDSFGQFLAGIAHPIEKAFTEGRIIIEGEAEEALKLRSAFGI